MIVSVVLRQVNSAFRGTDDSAPSVGTPDYAYWMDVLNIKLNEYATDPDVHWQTRFEPDRVLADAIVAGTQAYDLAADFFEPSDVVLVTNGSQVTEFTVVKPSERGTVMRSVYIDGDNPKQLVFYDEIATGSPFIGGEITVPGYFIPAELSTSDANSVTVEVDDPYWLIYAMAAELSFNSLTYESKSADLQAKAQNRWTRMVKRNRAGTADNPRKMRTNVQRIPGSNR